MVRMKIRKYLLIIILLLILANITCINAMDNDTCTAEIISQNFTDSNTNEQTNTPLQTNHKTSENLHPFEENDQLSAGPSPPDNNYWNNENGKIYHTQLTLTINDTATFTTTKNTTLNLHLDWDLYMNQEYYNNCLIQIYENNTIIHTINISKQSNIEYEHNIHQTLDVTFPYTIKDKTELKAILLKIESNTLSFEEIKRINFTHLNRNTIIVNNNYFSNENWTNQLKYLKKQ